MARLTADIFIRSFVIVMEKYVREAAFNYIILITVHSRGARTVLCSVGLRRKCKSLGNNLQFAKLPTHVHIFGISKGTWRCSKSAVDCSRRFESNRSRNQDSAATGEHFTESLPARSRPRGITRAIPFNSFSFTA